MVSQSLARFEYGRHETFPVRYGWLGKGLRHLLDQGWYRADIDVADRLGLGTKMAKSLQFWLEANGLAVPSMANLASGVGAPRRRKTWRITEFGRIIAKLDPYFEYPASWWFMHMSMVRRQRTVWSWFFADFHERRFSRQTCVEAFRSHASKHASNPPSLAMAQRDVGCLLQAYASTRGEVTDPEDATVCPLRDLGLVAFDRDAGRFEKTRPIDAIPVEAFLACASKVAEGNRVPLARLMSDRAGPARVFGLGSGQIESLAESASDAHPSEVQIDLLGAERTLVVPDRAPAEWLSRHFDRIRATPVAV